MSMRKEFLQCENTIHREVEIHGSSSPVSEFLYQILWSQATWCEIYFGGVSEIAMSVWIYTKHSVPTTQLPSLGKSFTRIYYS